MKKFKAVLGLALIAIFAAMPITGYSADTSAACPKAKCTKTLANDSKTSSTKKKAHKKGAHKWGHKKPKATQTPAA